MKGERLVNKIADDAFFRIAANKRLALKDRRLAIDLLAENVAELRQLLDLRAELRELDSERRALRRRGKFRVL